MMTLMMIGRHMLQMMSHNKLCNLVCNHADMLYNTKGVI